VIILEKDGFRYKYFVQMGVLFEDALKADIVGILFCGNNIAFKSFFIVILLQFDLIMAIIPWIDFE